MNAGSEATLHTVLAESQELGFLGDRPIDEVIDHAQAFVQALEGVSGAVVDLGSGGGVPGLVVAADRPDLLVTLLDRRTKRTDFLERVVRRLGWTDRVTVVNGDADRWWRELERPFAAATARGFGPPERTLRTALRFVGSGGRVVISEPPTGDRWASDLLVELGVERRPGVGRVACFVHR